MSAQAAAAAETAVALPLPLPLPLPRDEAALCERWAAGPRGLRLEDGRALRVIFPGVPGGGTGPDFRGAVLDAGGDLLRGDVEVHLRASGWRAHGHARDAAYTGVVLHVVAHNDGASATTLHASGRAIPIAVLAPQPGEGGLPPAFVPPCALTAGRGETPGPALLRMGLRRLRMKTARVAPLAGSAGAPQALYALALEQLGGSANRAAFAALARRLPLAPLLEAADGQADRALALRAELKRAAAALVLRRAGLRPLAGPGARIDAAAALVARWWPGAPSWPALLPPGAPLTSARAPGIGRAAAVELFVNAVLPVAAASGMWPEAEVEACFEALRSPGTYGRLRRLEGWLGPGQGKPFAGAAALQGGLLLHADYCTQGRCGRCPLSG